MFQKIKNSILTSILYKALLAMLLVSVPFTLGYGIFSYQQTNTLLKEEFMSELTDNMAGLRDTLQDIMKKSNDFNNYITLQSSLPDHIFREYRDPMESANGATAFFSEYVTLYNQLISPEIEVYSLRFFADQRFSLVHYLSKGSLAMLSSETDGLYSTIGIEQEEWFEKTLAADGEQFVFTSDEKNNFLYIAQAVKVAPNKVVPGESNLLGISLLGINTSRLINVLEQNKNTPNTTFAVLDDHNRVLRKSYQSPSDDYIISLANEHEYSSFIPTSSEDGKHFIVGMKINGNATVVAMLPRSDLHNSIRGIRSLLLFTLFATVLVSVVISVCFSVSLTKPIQKLSAIMSECEPENIVKLKLKASSKDEVGKLYHSFNRLIETIRTLVADIQIKNKQTREAELKMFQFQINPHFLYNALDSIGWKAQVCGQDEVADMTEELAWIFRYSTNSISSLSTLKEELEMLEVYVNLQRKRYDHHIMLDTQIDSDCLDLKLPKCLLQPLVENAILHWYNPDEEVNRITIAAQRTKNGYAISVMDNGRECNPEILNNFLCHDGSLPKENAIGLKNIKNRIHLSFGEASYLEFSKASDGSTVATIHIVNE